MSIDVTKDATTIGILPLKRCPQTNEAKQLINKVGSLGPGLWPKCTDAENVSHFVYWFLFFVLAVGEASVYTFGGFFPILVLFI